MYRLLALGSAVLSILGAACGPAPRVYELRGVVVAVDPARDEITIRHEDIPRFMPGMTMPFKVRDPGLLQGRMPGDVVRATLVVEESAAHIRAMERTGSAPVPESSSMLRPDLLEVGEALPDATFADQEGQPRRLSDWRGQALAVTFIYTRCPIPNFCPLIDRRFRSAQRAILDAPGLRGRARLLSVSFDPEHDTPPVLAAHAGKLEANPNVWSFLTGEREALERFASRFGVTLVREEAPAGEIVHGLRTAIIDANGRLSAILPGSEWDEADLLSELRTALERR
jgi:protein SCO1/2